MGMSRLWAGRRVGRRSLSVWAAAATGVVLASLPVAASAAEPLELVRLVEHGDGDHSVELRATGATSGEQPVPRDHPGARCAPIRHTFEHATTGERSECFVAAPGVNVLVTVHPLVAGGGAPYYTHHVFVPRVDGSDLFRADDLVGRHFMGLIPVTTSTPVELRITATARDASGAVLSLPLVERTYSAPAAPVQAPASAGRFGDDDGDVHEANIELIVSLGITSGCSPTDARLYCPYASVTRGQMATFIVRAAGLPASPTDHFGDDGGDVHEDNINRAAAAGLTSGWASDGCGDGRFCPTKPLTRAEMATMVARAFAVPSVAGGTFTDIGSAGLHTSSIDALAGAGVVQGCAAGRYCPDASMTRAAMATIVAKAVRLP